MRPTALPAWSPRVRSVRLVTWSAAAPGRGAYRRGYSLARASSAVTAATATTTRATRALTAVPPLTRSRRRRFTLVGTFGRSLRSVRLVSTFACGGTNRLARRPLATISAVSALAARLRPIAAVSGIAFRLWLQRLHGQAQPAAFIAIDELHLHTIALLDHVLRLLRAAVAHLRNVEQRLRARQNLDERAEGRGALHEPFVGIADDRLLRDRLDHLPRALHRLATNRGDRDGAGVVDADLRARLVLDTANGLALRSDQIADLLGIDLHGHNTGRVGRQVRLRGRQCLLHLR